MPPAKIIKTRKGKEIRLVIEFEGYSEENMGRQMFDLLADLNFVRVATHLMFCTKSSGLRDNTVYFKCEMEGYNTELGEANYSIDLPDISPILAESSVGMHEEVTPTFTITCGGEVCGWYEAGRNILWMPDLFHHRPFAARELTGLQAFLTVMDAVAKCQDRRRD